MAGQCPPISRKLPKFLFPQIHSSPIPPAHDLKLEKMQFRHISAGDVASPKRSVDRSPRCSALSTGNVPRPMQVGVSIKIFYWWKLTSFLRYILPPSS